MSAPLYDALRVLAAQNTLRLHMPGHKGKPLPAPEFAGLSAIDFTELPPTGNLFSGGGVIGQAEALWAKRFGMEQCLFLTGGATLGLQAALRLTCHPGDQILLDRVSHRAIHNAMALLDLRPTWLSRPWLCREGITAAISPLDVEKLLSEDPEIKTVCITSPTYYGVLSDIRAIAAIVHRHGGKLVVDGAHGAHLPFLGDTSLSAADVVVVSAHKTLPAMGQTALLFANGFEHEALRAAASLFSTSSPSYVMMASLDVARAYMEEEGTVAYLRAAEEVAHLRQEAPCLTEEQVRLDPTRLVLFAKDGFFTEMQLQKAGIFPEMADIGHVVCILSCGDTQADFARFRRAIPTCGLDLCGEVPPPPTPGVNALSPRDTFAAARESIPLCACDGRICADCVAPYPPGVPVLSPGERVEKKHLAYLQKIGYNTEERIAVVSATESEL